VRTVRPPVGATPVFTRTLPSSPWRRIPAPYAVPRSLHTKMGRAWATHHDGLELGAELAELGACGRAATAHVAARVLLGVDEPLELRDARLRVVDRRLELRHLVVQGRAVRLVHALGPRCRRRRLRLHRRHGRLRRRLSHLPSPVYARAQRTHAPIWEEGERWRQASLQRRTSVVVIAGASAV
jgi:hypothetical protein